MEFAQGDEDDGEEGEGFVEGREDASAVGELRGADDDGEGFQGMVAGDEDAGFEV